MIWNASVSENPGYTSWNSCAKGVNFQSLSYGFLSLVIILLLLKLQDFCNEDRLEYAKVSKEVDLRNVKKQPVY